MATSTLPARVRVIHRQSRKAAISVSAVITYSPRWVDGWFSRKPKMVLKSASPLVPPRFISLRLNTTEAETEHDRGAPQELEAEREDRVGQELAEQVQREVGDVERRRGRQRVQRRQHRHQHQ